MADLQTTPHATDTAHPDRTAAHKKWLIALAVLAPLATLIIFGIYFANAHWPYRYRIVKPLLENALGSQLTIAHYHRTYFPNPGFVASGITLRRKTAPDIPPLGSAETLVVQGRWSDLLLLRKRVQLVEINSLHMVIPAPESRASREDFPPGSASDFAGPDTLIEQLKIHNGLLEVMRENGKRYPFPIQELNVSGFQKGRAIEYSVDMRNAKPRGRIQSVGSFGPLNSKSLGLTPVSGTFTFSSVKLHDIGDISGTLASTGHFTGQLGAIEASANSQTSDFAVASGKPTPISADSLCTVNGLTGEVVIHSVSITSAQTTIIAKGAVQGTPRIANIDFFVVNGRAQDVMRPFMHDNVPIAGSVWLHGHAYVAPSDPRLGFLQRLTVDGAFDVPGERLTDQSIEKSLSAFSSRARDKKSNPPSGSLQWPPEADVVSSLQGSVTIRNGIAASPHLSFQVAGAHANLSGTFDFHNKNVHLVGNLETEADLSHDTTGFKAFLLKPIAPFLKKHDAGAVVPIAVTGGPGHYSVRSDFSHDK
jgi:hypothetical protein